MSLSSYGGLNMFGSLGILLAEMAKVGEIACANVLSDTFGFDELMAVKFTYVSLFAYAALKHEGLSLTTPYWKLHGLRILAGVLSATLATYSMMHLPVALAVSCRHLSSLYIALIVTVILLMRHEDFSKKRLFFVCTGFVGICFLSDWGDSASIETMGLAAGIVGAFFAALSALYLKKLGECAEPLARTVFYFTAVSAVWSWGLMIVGRWEEGIRWSIFVDPVMLLAVLFVIVVQFSRAFGWAKGEAVLNCVFQYTGLPIGILVGYLAFHETIEMSVGIGMAIILFSAFFASYVGKAKKA